MTKGIDPYHYGFTVGNVIFPPSEFALAWIGAHSPEFLQKSLDQVVAGILDGSISKSDAPLVHERITNGTFTLDHLRYLAEREYGTAKIIDRAAAREVNKRKHLGTMSTKHTLSMKIDSRELGQRQRPHEVTIYDPILRSLDEALDMKFEGGTLHAQKTQASGHHWSRGLIQDRNFLRNLGAHINTLNLGPNHISASDVKNDYNRRLGVADYTVAAALTTLDMLVNSKNNIRIRGLGDLKNEKVIIPYDFSQHSHFPFEAFLMMYDRGRKRNLMRIPEEKKRLMGIDLLFRGKSGFVTPLFAELYKNGFATKETMLWSRDFSKYTWALIQAWEQHGYEQGRRFAGYSQEFVGSEFETTSIVLDSSDGILSMRIIYDDNLGLPYLMYKTKKPVQGFGGIRGLGKRNPRQMVNWARDIHYSSAYVKKWVEIDDRTGERVLCSLYEPTLEVRQIASKLGRQIGQGPSPGIMRKMYINNAKN